MPAASIGVATPFERPGYFIWQTHRKKAAQWCGEAEAVAAQSGGIGRCVGCRPVPIRLRRSMLALIEKGEPHEAHPAYWAPFVVVVARAGAVDAIEPVQPKVSPRKRVQS